MATKPAPRPRMREREIVLATRALFDERGMRDAAIEEIARAVGIARGLIYRSFSSKEELYVLTVTTYLDELAVALEEAAAGAADGPEAALRRVTEAYARYCVRFPAFLDCQLALMHRPARELQDVLSDSVWLRLGQGMARCLGVVAAVLREGEELGVFAAPDPDLAANVLWTQGLGIMHLARIQVGVRQTAPGVPELFRIDAEHVVATCVRAARASVSA